MRKAIRLQVQKRRATCPFCLQLTDVVYGRFSLHGKAVAEGRCEGAGHDLDASAALEPPKSTEGVCAQALARPVEGALDEGADLRGSSLAFEFQSSEKPDGLAQQPVSPEGL